MKNLLSVISIAGMVTFGLFFLMFINIVLLIIILNHFVIYSSS